MRNLSVMEQKQVVGGYYVVKVYKYSDGNYLKKYYPNTENEAKRIADDWNSKKDQYGNQIYHAIYFEIR